MTWDFSLADTQSQLSFVWADEVKGPAGWQELTLDSSEESSPGSTQVNNKPDEAYAEADHWSVSLTLVCSDQK